MCTCGLQQRRWLACVCEEENTVVGYVRCYDSTSVDAKRVERLATLFALATPLKPVKLQQHQQDVLGFGAQPQVVSCSNTGYVRHGTGGHVRHGTGNLGTVRGRTRVVWLR